MPATKKSAFDLHGQSFRTLMDRHKDDPIRYGFGAELPPGINGIAELTACYVKVREEDGVAFWRAEGTILSPTKHVDPRTNETVVVKGLTTSIVYFQSSVPEENAETARRITEELRKLGGESFLTDNPTATVEELSQTVAAANPPIRFRFSTSLGKEQIDPKTKKPKINPKTGKPYEPRVFHNWNGTRGLGEVDSDFASGAFLDGTGAKSGAEPSANGSPASAFDDGGDLGTLLLRARNKDADADERLRGFCRDRGVSDEDYDGWDYDQVEEFLRGKPPAAEAEAPATKAKTRVPVVGKTVTFAPPDPKHKGEFLKPTPCEVVEVNGDTCVLKPLSSPKARYRGVAFDRLTFNS